MKVSERDIYKLIIEKKAFKISALLPHMKECFPPPKSDFIDEEKRKINNTVKKFNRAKDKFVNNRKRVDYESILEKADEKALFECESDDEADAENLPTGQKHWSQQGHRDKIKISAASNIEKMISDFAEREQISPEVYLQFLLTRFKYSVVPQRDLQHQ